MPACGIRVLCSRNCQWNAANTGAVGAPVFAGSCAARNPRPGMRRCSARPGISVNQGFRLALKRVRSVQPKIPELKCSGIFSDCQRSQTSIKAPGFPLCHPERRATPAAKDLGVLYIEMNQLKRRFWNIAPSVTPRSFVAAIAGSSG